MSEDQLIHRIKESYLRSLQANIDFHSQLAIANKDAGETSSAKRHSLLANVYKALIKRE